MMKLSHCQGQQKSVFFLMPHLWHHSRTTPKLLSKEICCLQKSETETLKTHAKRIFFASSFGRRTWRQSSKAYGASLSYMMMFFREEKFIE
jgi:hypothetical protein